MVSTHGKNKGFPRAAPVPVQSSVHLQGSVRISQYGVSRVYDVHYILSLICFETSTISTKFHQALTLEIVVFV